jgi:hypothetical protein
MDPSKLAEFSKNNLVSSAASKYLHHIINTEMPAGLKKYMDVKLFPRLILKPGCGISSPLRLVGSTAKVSGIQGTRSRCITMDMTAQTWLNIARRSFAPDGRTSWTSCRVFRRGCGEADTEASQQFCCGF